MTGLFQGTSTFGEAPGIVTNLTSISSSYNGFIAKYNSDGSLAWAKRISGSSWVGGTGVSSLSDGSSVVIGQFSGTISFGEAPGAVVNLSTSGSRDTFIAKYNTDGSLAWAKKAAEEHWLEGVTTLGDGSSVITGYFEGDVTFGEAPGNVVNLTSAGNGDIFIAKYNADGSLAWAKRAGGVSWESGMGVSSFIDGSIVITGYFSDLATFGEAPGSVVNLTSAGNGDIFIAKYNADGSLAWAKRAGGAGGESAQGISSFYDGSFVISGYTNLGIVTFGLGDPGETVLDYGDDYGGFIAKYNSNGVLE